MSAAPASTAGGTSPKKISKEYFPVEKKITPTYACSVAGPEALQWSAAEKQQAADELEFTRKAAKTFAKPELTRKYLLAARANGIEVDGFNELCKKFRDDDSLDLAKQLWQQVMFGWADHHPEWDLIMESDYMSMKNLEYIDDGSSNKGCFAKTFMKIRSELNKTINRAPKSTHQGKIRKKRMKDKVEATGKHKRRKQGECLVPFYSNDKTNCTDPGVHLNSPP